MRSGDIRARGQSTGQEPDLVYSVKATMISTTTCHLETPSGKDRTMPTSEKVSSYFSKKGFSKTTKLLSDSRRKPMVPVRPAIGHTHGSNRTGFRNRTHESDLPSDVSDLAPGGTFNRVFWGAIVPWRLIRTSPR